MIDTNIQYNVIIDKSSTLYNVHTLKYSYGIKNVYIKHG